MTLRAPFPWFGGKSRAAPLVWPRFGDVPNYIEPFAGSLAVLLARPHAPRVETVNDKDCYLVNFWRAVQANPDAVACYADGPVNEADLHARHRWLVTHGRRLAIRCTRDPHYCHPKVAGWWVWGQCLWIGSGWCARPEWTGRVNAGRRGRGVHTKLGWVKRPVLHRDGQRGVIAPPIDRGLETDEYANRPDLSSANGRGAVLNTRNGDTSEYAQRPDLTSNRGVIAEKRPYLGGHGQGVGVHKVSVVPHRRPNMGGAGGGQGVQAPRLTAEQVPQLSGDGSGSSRGLLSNGVLWGSGGLYAYMQALATRLRRVRVCCGDWTRVLTPAVTTYIGVTGVLLDPPYSHTERSICYSHDEDFSAVVRAWAIEHGEDPQFRIALCGYEGEHAMPASWDCVPWTAGGGYGRSARGKANRHRERIWFSPFCLPDVRHPLLAEAAV